MFSVSKMLVQILVQITLPFQLCVLFIAVLPSPAVADPIFFQPKTYKMTLETSFFDSDANFSPEENTFESLGNGKYFKIRQLGLRWDWVVSKRDAWRFGLIGAQAESFDGSFVRKNLALTELLLGYQYFLNAQPIKIKPEIFFTYPVKKVKKGTDETTPSEGALVVRMGLWFQKKWLSLHSYAYLGYAHRGEGRSNLAEYTLGTKKDFGRLGLGAEISGFHSVTNDKYTGTPTLRSTLTNAVNGGNRKFYSVNPHLLTSKFYVNMRVKKNLSLGGGYGIDLGGRNIGKGNTIYFNLFWSLSASRLRFIKIRRQKEPDNKLKKFDVEATEYDESLFQEPKPRPRRSKRSKRSKSIDQMLDETEAELDK